MLRTRRFERRPGWHPDPTGRHRYREWNGRSWTEHVSDYGRASIDPFETQRPGRSRKAKRRNLLVKHPTTAATRVPANREQRNQEWRRFWGDSA